MDLEVKSWSARPAAGPQPGWNRSAQLLSLLKQAVGTQEGAPRKQSLPFSVENGSDCPGKRQQPAVYWWMVAATRDSIKAPLPEALLFHRK